MFADVLQERSVIGCFHCQSNAVCNWAVHHEEKYTILEWKLDS